MCWLESTVPAVGEQPTRHNVDEYGTVRSWQDRNVADWRFVSVFLSITEYLLIEDKNDDNTVPLRRAEALWRLLEAKGIIDIAFCPRKWSIVRNELERRQMITVDHTWYRGKAMCWWPGPFFPGLGLWKTPKPRRMLEPVALAEFLEEKKGEEREHNTYMEHNNGCSPSVALASRGPPCSVTIRGSTMAWTRGYFRLYDDTWQDAWLKLRNRRRTRPNPTFRPIASPIPMVLNTAATTVCGANFFGGYCCG